MIPKHFRLKSETPNHFEIHDQRDGKSFHIAKKDLSLPMLGELSKIQHFDEGGSVQPEPNASSQPQEPAFDPDSLPYGDNSPEKSTPIMTQIGQGLRHGMQERMELATDVAGTLMKPGIQLIKGLTGSDDQSTAGSDDQAAAAATTQAGAQPPPTQAPPAGDANAQPQGNAQPDPLISRSMDMNDVLSREEGAISGGAAAEAAAGRKQAAALEQFRQDQLAATQDFQERHAQFQDADDALQKQILDKSIDPEHWWHSRSTGQKISAGIGMLLSGMGSAMSSQPNHAMTVINNAIERDIDAQKNDQSKTMNLWKMNHQAMQDDLQTHLSMRNQALTAVETQIKQYTAEAAGPLAAARAAPVIAQIRQQKAQNNFQRAALSQTANGGMIGADPSLFLSMIPEKDQPQAAKEIANAQEIKKLKDDFMGSWDDLNKKFLAGVLSPSDRQSAINAFAGRIAKLSEGRFNLEEAGLQAKALLPGALESDATRGNKRDRSDQFFDSMVTSPVFQGATGIPLNRFPSTNTAPAPKAPDLRQQQIDWVRRNAGSTDPQVQRRVQFVRQKYRLGS